MFRHLAVASAVLALSATTTFAADAYQIDKAHSMATFKVRHLISKVTGRFGEVGGVINFDRTTPVNSTVEFTVQTASVNTDNDARDKHLRSKDFFEVDKYPTMNFKSAKIVATGKTSYNVTGALTMKGITKIITLPVELNGFAKDPWGNERVAFETSTTINRKEFNILWNQSLDEGGYLLGDDVDVQINIEAVKQKPAAVPAVKK